MFGWEALLRTDAPPSCRLKAALFTTYERADTRFLAEHLLPLFLKLERDPESEGKERQYYLLELDRKLRQLHGKIVVVSSVVREEPTDIVEETGGEYDWLWRSMRNLTVGSNGRAVQHAKLWMMHWQEPGTGKNEYLELVVSSANLTMAACKGQIQGVWRICLPLKSGPSKSRTDGWGVLPDFLRELAKSAGDEKQLAPFTDLLDRAECPKLITFVASVPGVFSKEELHHIPWGVAGLRDILPQRRRNRWMSVFCPYIGMWSAEKLRQWCDYIGVEVGKSELVWINKRHHWAKQWILPKATLQAFQETNMQVLDLTGDFSVHNDHFIDEDRRWSHAKVYAFRGGSEHILITSANFSQSAWGTINNDGGITIKNFELGVCVEKVLWPFDGLDEFTSNKNIALVEQLPPDDYGFDLWGQAVWNGKTITIDCRCSGYQLITGELYFAGGKTDIVDWKTDAKGVYTALVVWEETDRPPLSVCLMCAQVAIQVAVFDVRSGDEIAESGSFADNSDLIQEMRDELLFEEYGGCIPDEEGVGNGVDNGPDPGHDQDLPGGESAPPDDDVNNEDGNEDACLAGADSYAVPVFEMARRYYGIVDNWSVKMKQANAGFEQQMQRRGGELLVAAFARQVERDARKGEKMALAAKLAGEEMSVRLKHLKVGNDVTD